MAVAEKTLAKCMGIERHREQCNHCRRLPLKPKDEDGVKWTKPPLCYPGRCPDFKQRA